MTLKQECIDMIKLITDPLAEKDDMYEYEINENSCIGFCLEKGEDDYSCFCYGCEKLDQCSRSRMIHINVDIELTSPVLADDAYWYFVFGRKEEYQELRGKIYYINTHTQLMNAMKAYKKKIEDFKDGYADFGKRYSDIMDYAKEFTEKIKEEHDIFKIIHSDILPVVMHWDYRKDHDWNKNVFVGGDYHVYGKQSVINIYCSMDADTENIKQRVRHEILHYCLAVAGFKSGDNEAVFHYLCGLYDADAYMQMTEDEQSLYERFLKAKNIVENNKQFSDEDKKNIITFLVSMIAVKQEDMKSEIYKSKEKLLASILSLENANVCDTGGYEQLTRQK